MSNRWFQIVKSTIIVMIIGLTCVVYTLERESPARNPLIYVIIVLCSCTALWSLVLAVRVLNSLMGCLQLEQC